jgi:hypothetical protein
MNFIVWYLNNCLWKKENIFPTYRPIGHNAESERGKKRYFNLGLAYIFALC